MKPLKLLSMSILIASALFLSAASGAQEPNPKAKNIPEAPSPQVSQQTENSRDVQKSTAPAPSAFLKVDRTDQNRGKDDSDTSTQREATYTGLLVIVGIAAIVISAFQYWAARASASASREGADAAIAASTAYLHLMRLWLEGQEGRGADVMDGSVGVADPVLHYGFSNYGKTPATLIEMCWESTIAPRLPVTPVYRNQGELGAELFVVAAEQDIDHGFQWSHLFGTYLTEDHIAPVRRTEQRLYVFGFFGYRDVFERRWRVGFAYHFDVRGQAHVVAPDIAPNYWYRTCVD